MAFDINTLDYQTGNYTQGVATPTTAGNVMQTNNTGMNGIGGNNGMNLGLGFNMDTAKLALSGLGTIGNIWMAYQAQQLAKEQFDYTKDITNTNLANEIQSYNTNLTDRVVARHATEGKAQTQTDEYLAANKLTK